ncbi:hypothetical protein ACOSP7_028420 [Xanthoceras sorbifolium]
MSIKVLQTNIGKKYQAFTHYLKQHDILLRFLCPYTYQQNGVLERKHRHIVEICLTMLAHSKMPLTFWVEAFQAATLLINNLPILGFNNISPYEKLTYRKPNYHYFKIFGCAYFPYLTHFSS